MPRDLSSAQTFPTKIIFPALWIGGFGLGTMALFVAGDSFHDKTGAAPPAEIKWIFLAAWTLGSMFIYWGCVRLKRVRMDETSLYISNYLREVPRTSSPGYGRHRESMVEYPSRDHQLPIGH